MCRLFGFAINEVNVCIIEFVGGVVKNIYNTGTLGLLIDVENVTYKLQMLLILRLHNFKLYKFKLYIENHIIKIIFVGVFWAKWMCNHNIFGGPQICTKKVM
jgi:hypothetical protein